MKSKNEEVKHIFFMPGIEAMVKDGLYQDIETAKKRLLFLFKKTKAVHF